MKPDIEIVVKFPDGDKRTMTREQARELRDALNDVIGNEARIVATPPNRWWTVTWDISALTTCSTATMELQA